VSPRQPRVTAAQLLRALKWRRLVRAPSHLRPRLPQASSEARLGDRGTPRTDQTQRFYDALASDYDLIFADWQASVRGQAEILDRIIRGHLASWPLSVLDCTCGIGTQAIGLALRGYRVHATDFSVAAVERAQREAAVVGATLTFGIADVRSLAEQVTGHFDVVLSCDNALPHLLSDGELRLALRHLSATLTPGGLLLVSIRDYDALLDQKPQAEPPRVFDGLEGRRIVFQVWDWEPEAPLYLLHHFILRQEGDDWRTTHRQAPYRALRRAELSAMLGEVGFRDVRWQLPGESGYPQPVLIARKPNGWPGGG
jgi:glycine/sarcosine N-methyltransferase